MIAVQAKDRDPVTGARAKADQRGSEPRGAIGRFRPASRAAVADRRGLVAPELGCAQDRLDKHSNPLSHLSSCIAPPSPGRSEEHTSELQSLMRTSYAVFCLKNKNT